MKISIVIPTYNRPNLLNRCLSSLLTQDIGPEYEIIVVSDGLDEASQKAIAAFGSKVIKHFELETHKGPAAARNLGVQKSSGELIMFTDDDTLPTDTWANAFWNCYQRHGDHFVAFVGRVLVPLTERPTDYELNISGLESAEFVTANCAITRDAFEVSGGFDESFTMAWREDSDLHFKLIKCAIPIIKCPEAEVRHPVRKSSWNVSLASEKKNMFNALLYKRHPELYSEKVEKKPKWNYYVMIVAALIALYGIVLGKKQLWQPAIIIWLSVVVLFTLKRVWQTKKTPGHILQMFVTSALIPFYSVFWKLYGSVKFKKLLL